MEIADTAPLDGVTRATSDAFEEFFTAQYADLAGYCESLVGPDLADELAQESLARVYARWPVLRDPRAYAFRVATNLARDLWRNRKREIEGWETRLARRVVVEPDPHLWDVVAALPERLRVVVVLHYVADLPLADVAHAVRRPLGTVKRRLHEARLLLADQLRETP